MRILELTDKSNGDVTRIPETDPRFNEEIERAAGYHEVTPAEIIAAASNGGMVHTAFAVRQIFEEVPT